MSSEITPRDVAVLITTPDVSPETVRAFVADLPLERLAPFTLSAQTLIRLVQSSVKEAEARMVAEGLVGMTHTDEDGDQYRFEGSPRREIGDVPGFVQMLEDSGIGLAQLAGHISKDGFRLAGLEAAYGDKVKAAIKEFTNWRIGPPHLVALDKGGKHK